MATQVAHAQTAENSFASDISPIGGNGPTGEPSQPETFDANVFNVGNFAFSTTHLNTTASPSTYTVGATINPPSPLPPQDHDEMESTGATFDGIALHPGEEEVTALVAEGINENGVQAENTPLDPGDLAGIASMDTESYDSLGGGTDIIDDFNFRN